MAVLTVARLGHPVLRRVADPVDLAALTAPGDGNELQTFIDDMIDTMHEEGGVGIAAPQVSSAPADPALWKFEGNTTRTTFDAEFPIEAPAQWDEVHGIVLRNVESPVRDESLFG